MKGTKLWQSPGSPIIQGRSRRQRPSWQQWLPAWIVSATAVAAFAFLVPTWPLGAPVTLLLGGVGAIVGAIAGVQFTRSMGWRFPWFWGSVVGIASAALVLVLTVALLPT